MKLHIILREFSRSFIKNAYMNVLLMVLLGFGLFISMTMITYFYDIGDSREYNLMKNFDDRDWYAVRADFGEGLEKLHEVAMQPGSMQRMQKFYEHLTNNDKVDYISFRDEQCVYLRKDELVHHFGNEKFDNILNTEVNGEDVFVEIEDMEGRKFTAASVKSLQMDRFAMDELNMEFGEGEGFTKENTTIKKIGDPLPVVLGNAYQGSFQIGDEFEIDLNGIGYVSQNIYGDYMKVKVVGVLSEGQKVTGWGANDWVETDDYIICATGCHFENINSRDKAAEKYFYNQFSDNLMYSFIALKEGVTYNEAISEINATIQKYDVFPLDFTSISFGTEILQNETKTSIFVLTLLAVIMLGFMYFCLISNAISKFRKNSQTYAIYIVNGCGMGEIVISYVLEMILILMPGVMANYYILEFRMFKTGNVAPFLMVVAMAVIVILIVTTVVQCKLKTLNIEEYMRKE